MNIKEAKQKLIAGKKVTYNGDIKGYYFLKHGVVHNIDEHMICTIDNFEDFYFAEKEWIEVVCNGNMRTLKGNMNIGNASKTAKEVGKKGLAEALKQAETPASILSKKEGESKAENFVLLQRMAAFDTAEAPRHCIQIFQERRQYARMYLSGCYNGDKTTILDMINQCNSIIKVALAIN